MRHPRRYRTAIRYSLTHPDIEPIRSEQSMFSALSCWNGTGPIDTRGRQRRALALPIAAKPMKTVFHLRALAVGLIFAAVAIFTGEVKASAAATSAPDNSVSTPYSPSQSGSATDTSAQPGAPFQIEQLLPPSIAESTNVNAWGWFSYLHDSNSDESSYGIADVALGLTQRLGTRATAVADIHFIDDNGPTRGFLEQAFVTVELSENAETLLTVGKFNASFGVEPRNEWDRLSGTSSLLFGAQPQDLVGVMLTQPVGDFKIRPFVATQFQGHAVFDGAPSGGLLVQYQPSDTLRASFTNWIGPGFAEPEGDDDDDDDYAAEAATDNWQGPDLDAVRSGVLYFADANVQWNPRPDLTLAAEALVAITGDSLNQLGWNGFLLLANYDLTDRWRVFGRWSLINDAQGFVTGEDQTQQEVSGGVGYQIISGLELRGEYRHDFARSGDLDSISAHLTFSY